MGIKLVVFDIAGTTLHDESNVALVLQQAIKTAGVTVSVEEVNEVMGYAKPFAIRHLLEQKQDARFKDPVFIDQLHEQFVQEMKNHYAHSPAVREKTGTTAVLKALKEKGIKVGLDTGFDRGITNVILERVGWHHNGLIDAVVTSDEVPKGRPYPYMIYRTMEQLGIQSIKAVAKVGDTVSDLEEGTNAGCRYVIGVTTGAYTRSQLAAGPHTHLIATLDELFTIL